MFAQRVGHFVPHHHRGFVFREFQLVEDAGIKSDLPARHAERVDLLAANQIDLPIPPRRPAVPLRRMRDDAPGDTAQPHQLGVVVRCECLLSARLVHHLRVLLQCRSFDLISRNQTPKFRRIAHIHLGQRRRDRHRPGCRCRSQHKAAPR